MRLALAAVSPIVLHCSPLISFQNSTCWFILETWFWSSTCDSTAILDLPYAELCVETIIKSADYVLLSILVFVTKCMHLTQNVCELAPLLQQNSCLIDLLN